MVGAALLHSPTFDELKADKTANYRAVLVVVLAALAIGFGVGPGYAIPLGFVVWWLSWWAVWVFLVYLTWPLFTSRRTIVAEWSHLARPTGFAQSPAVFMVLLSFITGLGPSAGLIVFTLVGLWWFASIVVAVRQALGLRSTARAAAVASTYLVPSIIIELGLF